MVRVFRYFMMGLIPFIILGLCYQEVIGSETELNLYTKIDIEKDCRPGRQYEEGQGAEWWCPGLKDIEVLIAEGDLRYFLGYGPYAQKQKSFSQTLSSFNTIGKTLNGVTETLRAIKYPTQQSYVILQLLMVLKVRFLL